jgi:hypothetical protein
LLEQLYRFEASIVESKIDFSRKEISITVRKPGMSLKGLVMMLHELGYGPDLNHKLGHKQAIDPEKKQLIRKLAVAGFAFGNVMLLSFHEYLSTGGLDEPMLQATIHTLSILISTPVLGYIGLAICSRLGCDFSNDLHPARLGLRHSVFESKYRHFLPTGSCGTCLSLSQQSDKHETLFARKLHR